MRLDKLVSMAGATRSEAKKLIASGKVRVNGEILKNPSGNVPDDARLEIMGSEIGVRKEIHIMMNKPAGLLTAMEDARGAGTVAELLPEAIVRRRIGPVGRLDKDVTGLLLLTTDGQLAHRLISPKWEIEKRYRATVEGRLDAACARKFEAGIAFKEFTALPAVLQIESAGEDTSECLVFVKEGKYHQVKRMLQAVGHPVIRLHREKVGPVELDASLTEGEWRYLTDAETEALYKIAEMDVQ